ncbi:MAG: TetR family transcriptional regulator [Lachnospiraceae bacterium]|jgi:AcrR family transcriptional regulator
MVYVEEGIHNSMMIDDSVGRKILDTAAAIISREGYENLTIRKVAKESGCSNSAIYQHFGDKNALSAAIAALQAKPLLVVMDEAYSRDADLSANIDRVTKSLLEKLYSFELEAVYMQIAYRGRLRRESNPFLLRVESYLKDAASRGEVDNTDISEKAFFLSSSFWGFVQMVRADKDMDLERAKILLEVQNRLICNGIRMGKRDGDFLWDTLREKGVDVDRALARMKGDKEAYRNFLMEFFADPDFEALGTAVRTGDAEHAFEYAHGLKGMAANLGLDEVRSRLSVLVEILRPGGLDGAAEAYDEVMEACRIVTVLL